MIDYEGYYQVPPDQVAYIETRVCGTEQRRREKPLIRSSHDRSRSGNDRTGRTSCIACG